MARLRGLLLQTTLLLGVSIIGAFSVADWLAGAVLAPGVALAVMVMVPRLLKSHEAFGAETGSARS